METKSVVHGRHASELLTRRDVVRIAGLMPASLGLSAAIAQEARTPRTIILLKPAMRFEDLRGESRVPPQAAEDMEYRTRLLDAARKHCGSKGAVVEQAELEPPAAEACGHLQALASRMARGNINDDVKNGLLALAALDENYAVLAQFLLLKVGTGGSWNPLSGNITSRNDSTLLHACLVSCDTGQVIWKNQQLIRKALKAASSGFQNALDVLYRDFDVR